VVVDEQVVGQIDRGLLVLLGVGRLDEDQDARTLAAKIVGLRIFEDPDGKMNLDLASAAGRLLVVSQFTLFGDCRKGRRPSFLEAAPPDVAERLYQAFVSAARALGAAVETGQFRQHMHVELSNDGPVTLWIDTAELG
jgi:D-tyrosyl-tRNA(Tyr) deacylase